MKHAPTPQKLRFRPKRESEVHSPSSQPQTRRTRMLGNFVDSGDRVGGFRDLSRDGCGVSGHAVSFPRNSRVSRGRVSRRRAAPGQGRPDLGEPTGRHAHLHRLGVRPPRLPQGPPGGRSWCPDRRPRDDGATPPGLMAACVCMWGSGSEPRPWRRDDDRARGERSPFNLFRVFS